MGSAEVDVPLSSEIIKTENGTGYRWVLTETERAHMGSMLDTDVKSITLKGNIMTRDRTTCKCCGKSSGLDDLVENALSQGIHGATC